MIPRFNSVLIGALAILTAGSGHPNPDPVSSSALRPDSDTAAVYGHVSLSGPEPSPPGALSPYARRRYRPPQPPGIAGGAEDAVVYLEPLDRAPPPSTGSPVTILQRERTIAPHVAVVRLGEVVDFPNEDDVFHNLFSLSSGNRFSLGRYSPGATRTHRFGTPGVVRMFCDIHAEMAGVILVVSTPWTVRPDPDGSYRLSGVPSGSYRAIAWHPNAGADTAMVSLTDGERREVRFSLTSGP